VNKNWEMLETQALLQANPQAALPLLSMIGQAQLSIRGHAWPNVSAIRLTGVGQFANIRS